MFTKLRNKFVALTVAITALVLLSVFSVIYVITAREVAHVNQEKLRELALDPFFPNMPGIQGISQLFLPQDYRPSFTLLMDEEGAIIQYKSYVDISMAHMRQAGEMAFAAREQKGPIRVGSRLWEYAFTAKGQYILTTEGNRSGITTSQVTTAYIAVFLDVTDSHLTLSNLLYTFLFVGAATLVMVFFVCLFLGGRAVRPIRTAWEGQKRFIADASHELKTPLTIIQSNVGVLAANQEETIQSQMKWLQYIRDGAGRMETLIADLLSLARAEGDPPAKTHAPIDLSALLEREIAALQAAADSKNLTITRQIPPELHVPLDGEKLSQVIRILLDNAIKYAGEGGAITLSAKRERQFIILTVADDGPGIEPAHLPHIFDRFYRADDARAYHGGHGLGLAIAKANVKAMGGKITATSDVGKGTVFTVMIPVS